MSISSCPQCGKQVTIPTGVETSAKVRCPLCHSQYTLADALVNMPPLLELIDDDLADESDARTATPLAADVPIDFEADLADEEPGESLRDLDDFTVEDRDTEVEELSGLSESAPLAQVVPADLPLDLPADEGGDVLDFDAVPEEPAAAEEVEFELDDIQAAEPAVEEEISFDLDETQPYRPDAEIDADIPRAEPVAGEDEMSLDFGEPIEPEAAPVVALVQPESVEPAAADDKASKKKKKKEKKQKAEANGEPRKRSLLSTSLSVLVGSVFGLFVALYMILWIGPDYDLVGVAKYIPKSMLPQSYQRPYLAGRPDATGTMPQLPLQMPARPAEPEQTTETPAPSETPAEAPAEPAPSETPAETPATEPAATTTEPAATEPAPAPAADRPVDPITDAPAATKPEEMPEPATTPAEAPAPEVTTPTDETPPAPTNEKPATTPEPNAFDDAKPTEPAPSEPAPAEPAPAEPAPQPAEPVGPVQAASVSAEDLTKAIAAAQAADRQMTAAQGTASEADMKRIRSNFYLSMFRMADAVTFANSDPTVDASRQQLEQFSREFAADAKRIESLKFNSARWLAFGRRTTPGIMLAGKVQSAQPVGKLYEVRLAIGEESEAPVVTVLSATDPKVSPGDNTVVYGSIMDRPAEQLAGYQGDEATVVWNGLLVKLAGSN